MLKTYKEKSQLLRAEQVSPAVIMSVFYLQELYRATTTLTFQLELRVHVSDSCPDGWQDTQHQEMCIFFCQNHSVRMVRQDTPKK